MINLIQAIIVESITISIYISLHSYGLEGETNSTIEIYNWLGVTNKVKLDF